MRRVKISNSVIQYLSVLCLFFYPNIVAAEIPALEREVNLNVKNEKLTTVLNKIQEQSGVIFSYSPYLFKEAATISIQIKHKSVREVLAAILPLNIGFKAKNNYIILKEKEIQKSPKNQKISGYIYDANTDKKLANVTVYDKNTLESTTTDEYGYYSISVPAKNASLTVNRVNYEDTAVLVQSSPTMAITNISIQPKTDSLNKKDSAMWQIKLNHISHQTNILLNKFNKYMHTKNVSDSIERKIQFSLLPFIGTNHHLSGNVYNRFSFNILGGYSRGTKEFELGGLFNIDKENVNGLQIASLSNLVGDSMRGIQVAGIINLNGKKTSGVQIGGLSNINGGPVKGVQIGGLLNKNESDVSGLQIGGLMNYNYHFTSGSSIAGLVNLSKTANGLQIAGLTNMNDTTEGFVVAGLINVSNHHNNVVAFAGLFNHVQSGESRLQVASLFNKTAHLKVMQLALVNFSDSSSGVPVGLFSYVKKGLHQVEVSVDDVQYFNVNFRTGVPAFYNIFSSGIQPQQGDILWSFGYGLGSSFRVKGNLRSDVSFVVKHLSIGSFYQATSERMQLYWGLEYKFSPKFSIAGGPVMNWYVSDTKSDNYSSDYNSIAPKYSGSDSSPEGILSQYWLGGQISLRFY